MPIKSNEEYLNQGEVYFSESAKQFVPLDEMPIPHLFYAFRKMWALQPGTQFNESELCRAMRRILEPTRHEIMSQLRTTGKSSHLHFGNTTNIRSKYYSVGRKLGVKVHTHRTGSTIGLVTVDCPEAVDKVKVKGVTVE